MNLIENTPAAVFFADLLFPLRNANLQSGTTYLDRGSPRNSYWDKIISRTGGVELLPLSSCDLPALLGLLGSYWTRRSELHLMQLLPHLELLSQEVVAVVRPNDALEPPITEFVYPLA